MKLHSIVPMSFVFIGLAAIPSLAGESYVSNSSSWQVNCGKGFSESTFNESYSGSRLAVSAALKLEKGFEYKGSSYGGTEEPKPVEALTSSRTIESSDYSSTPESYGKGYNYGGYDYLAASASLNVEKGNFENSTHAYSYQSNNSYGGSQSHKVASGFSY